MAAGSYTRATAVSGNDANTLAEPMIRDLERCANGLRKDGVLALHLKHSFSPTSV